MHVQIARTLHVHGTKMNCTHILHVPILGSDGRPVGGALAHHVSSAHPQKRPLVSSAIGRILCCVRSILTNDGVSSSDGSMPIDFGGGTMQIGRLLVEISRFLFLKIFRISLHASYRFFSLFVPLDLFWQAFLWKATTWLSSATSARVW